MEILKVSSRSNPNSVAGAMAGVVRQTGAVEVQVVGAGALNQAVKAIAIARGYLTPSNVDLVCVPTFADIEIDGESRTAIRLSVEHRGHRHSSDADSKTATDGQAAGAESLRQGRLVVWARPARWRNGVPEQDETPGQHAHDASGTRSAARRSKTRRTSVSSSSAVSPWRTK